MTTNISRLAWSGVYRENPAGTAGTAPTMYVPVKSGNGAVWENKTKRVYSDDERNTRDGNNRVVGTVRMASGELTGDLYTSVFPYLLLSFMGGIGSVTQPDSENAPGAYEHPFTLADEGIALTWFKGYDHHGFQYAYSTTSKLSVNWEADGKLLTWKASVAGQYKTNIASFGSLTPTYADENALAGYAPIITIDDADSTDISKMQLDLEQQITLFYSSRGNRAFLRADYGLRTAKLTFTGRFDDLTRHDQLDAETDSHFAIAMTGANLGGSVVETVSFDFPIVGYDALKIAQDGDAQMVNAECTARPGSSKNSLFTASVINEVANYTH